MSNPEQLLKHGVTVKEHHSAEELERLFRDENAARMAKRIWIVWHSLRSHFWSNRIDADYDDLFGVAESTWCKTCLNPELIKPVCAKSDANSRTELLRSVLRPVVVIR